MCPKPSGNGLFRPLPRRTILPSRSFSARTPDPGPRRPDLADLFDEILRARQSVYEVAAPTPLEPLDLVPGADVFLKREDLSPIHAYKWRGAYHRMTQLTKAERDRGS